MSRNEICDQTPEIRVAVVIARGFVQVRQLDPVDISGIQKGCRAVPLKRSVVICRIAVHDGIPRAMSIDGVIDQPPAIVGFHRQIRFPVAVVICGNGECLGATHAVTDQIPRAESIAGMINAPLFVVGLHREIGFSVAVIVGGNSVCFGATDAVDDEIP